jgi:hypothetical protein
VAPSTVTAALADDVLWAAVDRAASVANVVFSYRAAHSLEMEARKAAKFL